MSDLPELPPLPEPAVDGNMGCPTAWTEEQMQAFAREAIRAAVERERAKWIVMDVSNVSLTHPPTSEWNAGLDQLRVSAINQDWDTFDQVIRELKR